MSRPFASQFNDKYTICGEIMISFNRYFKIVAKLEGVMTGDQCSLQDERCPKCYPNCFGGLKLAAF